MIEESAHYWESHLEALQKTEQYILNSLKLVEFDIESCKRRIHRYKTGAAKISVAEAMNYRPEDTLA